MASVMQSLSRIAAPMVDQSDLPFRILVRRYNASLAYTQMLIPERLLNDRDYSEYHLRGLGDDYDRPVVVQLCGNDPELLVRAGRMVQNRCDAVDLNLGCPQVAARDAHYGAYLLGQKDWPLLEGIVSAMSNSLAVPISAKLRLCQPASSTLQLAQRLEGAGVSWLTLHARHVSARRRRHGAADLEQVRRLKEGLRIPVVSNGNVRCRSDVEKNQISTGADGVMVGEELLENPCLFANITPDPVSISMEYLDICKQYPDTVSIRTIQAHLKHFFAKQNSSQYNLRYRGVSLTISQCEAIEEIEKVLQKQYTN